MDQDISLQILPWNKSSEGFQYGHEIEQTLGEESEPMQQQPFIPDVQPFMPEYLQNNSAEPVHHGYDAEFAIGVFTMQIGTYEASVDNAVHTVRPGDKFSIWAYENRTTGFRWIPDLDMDGPCKDHLKLVSENYFVKTSDPMMMGVGGTTYKTFQLSEDV